LCSGPSSSDRSERCSLSLSLFAKALLVDANPDSRWLDPLIAPGQQGDGDGPRQRGPGRDMKELIVLGLASRRLGGGARSQRPD
jgi:hypothetical protein